MNQESAQEAMETTQLQETKPTYESPQIESEYSPEQLDREFLYAGGGGVTFAP